jgi:hypothetical protein
LLRSVLLDAAAKGIVFHEPDSEEAASIELLFGSEPAS